MPKPISRSKHAIDVMHRIWDSVHSGWVTYQGRTIWTSPVAPNKAVEKLIASGRNPETLKVERVYVSVDMK